jgi:hypothetical protein
MDSIWIGYDPKETEAFAVCRRSLRTSGDLEISPLDLRELRRVGLYRRQHERRADGQMYDVISDAPMSTEFAISRFLTPILAGSGLALFIDCDILARDSLDELFDIARGDPSKAVWCVKHNYAPKNTVKMDGQLQTLYARKNWSSSMLFRVEHPANKRLTVDMINSVPGRDLHALSWLKDEEIGALPSKFNHLVGITQAEPDEEPVLVHFTNGGPWFESYEPEPYGEEWLAARRAWLAEDTYVQGRPYTWAGRQVEGSDAAYLR